MGCWSLMLINCFVNTLASLFAAGILWIFNILMSTGTLQRKTKKQNLQPLTNVFTLRFYFLLSIAQLVKCLSYARHKRELLGIFNTALALRSLQNNYSTRLSWGKHKLWLFWRWNKHEWQPLKFMETDEKFAWLPWCVCSVQLASPVVSWMDFNSCLNYVLPHQSPTLFLSFYRMPLTPF